MEQLVQQILDSHQTKPQPRTHNCLCTGSLGESGSLGAALRVRGAREVPPGAGATAGSRMGTVGESEVFLQWQLPRDVGARAEERGAEAKSSGLCPPTAHSWQQAQVPRP